MWEPNNADKCAMPIQTKQDGYQLGLTKREEFAKAAMQGLLAGEPGMEYEKAAEDAVEHADALLDALKRTSN